MTSESQATADGVGHSILLKRPGLYRTLRRGSDAAYLYDPSSLAFLLEEAIASGATQLAFTATSPARDAIKDLPVLVRKRIRFVDEDGSVAASVGALLKPVGDELGWEFRADKSLKTPGYISESLQFAIGTVFPLLFDFLLGSKYRLQIPIDPTRLRLGLEILRQHCKTTEARAQVAQIEGILQTYQVRQIPALGFYSHATGELANLFNDFVQDATYLELSRNTGLLGSPADGDYTYERIRRCARAVSEKKLYKPFVRLIEKAVEHGIHVPVPILEFIESLLPTPYIPICAPLDAAYAKAERLWTPTRPSIESIPGVESYLSNGWIEIAGAPQPTEHDFKVKSDEVL